MILQKKLLKYTTPQFYFFNTMRGNECTTEYVGIKKYFPCLIGLIQIPTAFGEKKKSIAAVGDDAATTTTQSVTDDTTTMTTLLRIAVDLGVWGGPAAS